MRGSIAIVSSVILSVALWGAAIAAPAAAPSAPANSAANAVSAPVEADCRKVGGEVSALIDKGGSSPNISVARSTFQRGIMDCMEGDDVTANRLYQQVKDLLGGEQNKAPAPAPKS